MTIVTDTFAGTGDLDSPWAEETVYGTKFIESSGYARGNDNANEAGAVRGAAGDFSSDFRFAKATLQFTTASSGGGGGPGLYVPGGGGDGYVLYVNNDAGWLISRQANGSGTTIATGNSTGANALVSGDVVTLTVKWTGATNEITVTRNANQELMISVSDATYQANTLAPGMYVYHTTTTDFRFLNWSGGDVDISYTGPIVQVGEVVSFPHNSNSNVSTPSSTIFVPYDADFALVALSGYGLGSTPGYFTGGTVSLPKGGVDTAMTAAGSDGDSTNNTWMGGLWYMPLPDTGINKSLKHDFVGVSTADDSIRVWSLTFWKGVDTSSPVRDSETLQTETLPVLTPTLTAQTDDLIVAWCAFYSAPQSGSGEIDTWTNLTELVNVTHNAYAEGSWATASPSGNVAVGLSAVTDTTEWSFHALVVKPATGGGGGPGAEVAAYHYQRNQ